MPKGHESKLFITRTMYRSTAFRYHVHRTRKAARNFAAIQRARKTVSACAVLPATWGPDAWPATSGCAGARSG